MKETELQKYLELRLKSLMKRKERVELEVAQGTFTFYTQEDLDMAIDDISETKVALDAINEHNKILGK